MSGPKLEALFKVGEENIFPEMNSFEVGDPALAKEIAKRWNTHHDLIAMLREAVVECEKHNTEYHHRTPDPAFTKWRGIINAAEETQ